LRFFLSAKHEVAHGTCKSENRNRCKDTSNERPCGATFTARGRASRIVAVVVVAVVVVATSSAIAVVASVAHVVATLVVLSTVLRR